MKYKYQGANSSMKVAGIIFAKDVEVELTAEQIKALKADRFGKAMIADGSLVEIKDAEDKDADSKPVSEMTAPELKKYITDNGRTFTGDDNKPDLLLIAQDIEKGK